MLTLDGTYKKGIINYIIERGIKMETRVETAIAKKNKGYNCAQAVACTYCDLVGVDEVTMFKLTEALGLGLGGMEGTCGALTGACVLAGMVNSTGNLESPDSMAGSIKLSKELTKLFLERNTTLVCKEIKGVGTGKMLRSCADCVRDAAEFAEKVLFSDK